MILMTEQSEVAMDVLITMNIYQSLITATIGPVLVDLDAQNVGA